MSLLDAVFKGKKELSGLRLKVLAGIVATWSRVYPEEATREQLENFQKTLLSRKTWTEGPYVAALATVAAAAGWPGASNGTYGIPPCVCVPLPIPAVHPQVKSSLYRCSVAGVRQLLAYLRIPAVDSLSNPCC